jgi:HEPN domain-containing protein
MDEAEHLAETRRWLRYAREDLEAAETLVEQQVVVPRHICWLAQQAAEKAIKSILVFLAIDFPRRHDLDALRNLIPPGWQVKEEQLDLAELTEWSVEARYPGDWPDATEADARSAAAQARAVWESVYADFVRHGFTIEERS